LLTTHVFPVAEEVPLVLQQLSTLNAILQAALQAEKNLVLFYDELMTQSQLPKVREAFAALKREEQDHVVRLQEMISGYA
jgi:rubrerythrin